MPATLKPFLYKKFHCVLRQRMKQLSNTEKMYPKKLTMKLTQRATAPKSLVSQELWQKEKAR